MSTPWLKWYPTDWRADPRLRMCSLAARGLWIELLGFMHEAESYGHLLISGRPPTLAQIASLVAAPVKLVERCLGELSDNGVFSVAGDGATIYSRRMIRDKAKADRDRENGRSGGNPKLRAPDKPGDKPQKPETRVQHEDAVASSAPIGAERDDRRKRGTRLSADWQPSREDRDFAVQLGLAAASVAADFRDYWIAAAGDRAVKLDWSATWRRWCRKAAADGAAQRLGPATGLAQGFADALRLGRAESGGDRKPH